MAQFQFNINNVEKRENNFELLPAGTYTAQVTESELVPLNSGNGTALKLTITILQQGYNGRKVFARLNVRHNNPEAERIANQQLRELCEAVGVVALQDTVELHNKPMQVRLKIREDKSGNFEPQNEVAGFKPATASAAQAPALRPASQPTVAQAPAASGSTPPWAKRAA